MTEQHRQDGLAGSEVEDLSYDEIPAHDPYVPSVFDPIANSAQTRRYIALMSIASFTLIAIVGLVLCIAPVQSTAEKVMLGIVGISASLTQAVLIYSFKHKN